MTLYRVEYTRLLYVRAESEDEAEQIARHAEANEVEITDVTVIPAESPRRAEADGWIDCEPYGPGPAGYTLRDLFKEMS